VALVVAFATACAAPSAPAAQTRPAAGSETTDLRAAAPKRITIAVAANVPILVERLSAGGVGVPGLGDIEKMISPGFSVVDQSGSQRPLLAEAAPTVENGLWTVFPDGRMETTWRIRQGARWHDGTPFTAEDVIFTATVDQDRDVPMRRSLGYASVESVDARDPGTVTVRWKRPYIQADALFTVPFFPRHLLEKTYLEEKAAFSQHPYFLGDFVGTGAFRVQLLALGSHLLLSANDQYVLGRPKIDEVEVKFIPDPNTMMANVLAGAVDLTLGRGISLEQALQVRDQWRDGKPDIAFTSWIVTYPQFLNPTPPIVVDPAFRRALFHALDRQQMAESLQAGLVPVAHTFLHPNQPDYRQIEGSIVRYDYDPRRAAQLMEGLGYTRGPDGALRDATGTRLSVEVRTSPEQDIQIKTIFVIADYWQKLGVGVEPVVMAEQRVRDREYVQTFPSFMTYRQPNDPSGLLLRLHSNQTPLPENSFVGRNHPRYMNPEFDALVDRYYGTVPQQERSRVLAEIIQHTTERLTLMGLFYDVEPVLVGNRLQGVAASKAADSTPAWNAEQWDAS
jgi:peptide/nickel transport system substrate-binding protein